MFVRLRVLELQTIIIYKAINECCAIHIKEVTIKSETDIWKMVSQSKCNILNTSFKHKSLSTAFNL